MQGVATQGGIKKGTMRMKVLNADGSVKKDLGLAGYYHRNPVLRFVGGKWVKFWSDRRIRRYNEEQNVLRTQ